MSKIFDALKKVQAEMGGGVESTDSAVESAAGEVGPGMDVPEEFAAEIVSMRYSVESKVSRAHKALLFTCSVSGEGVSLLSRLFSEVIVQDSRSKVVLVDANTHHPAVHGAFGVDVSPGLMDLLAGRNSLGECIHATAHPRLGVIPVGESTVSPMQAFASDGMKRMIRDVLAEHDYLVFDAPPVLAYPEVTILSDQVDGVLFVVQAIRTKKEVIKKAVDAVTKAGGEVLGVVLNKNRHFIPEFIYKRV